MSHSTPAARELVRRARDLSRLLQEDAAGRFEVLERTPAMNPGRERALLGELELIVLDLTFGTDLAEPDGWTLSPRP